MHITVIFGTTEGHTGKIARRLSAWAEELGHSVTLVDSAEAGTETQIQTSDAFIVAGSLHMERHQASLISFVRDHKDALSQAPSLFLSVSLTAVNDDAESKEEAQRCIEGFYHQSKWTSTESMAVAGALLYTHYDFFRRMVLKAIAKREGGPTDISQDYEFTDWVELRNRFEQFLDRCATPAAAVLPA